jgi:hypothetical protein
VGGKNTEYKVLIGRPGGEGDHLGRLLDDGESILTKRIFKTRIGVDWVQLVLVRYHRVVVGTVKNPQVRKLS